MSSIPWRKVAYPALVALALAACSGRRGTGVAVDSGSPPDDVPAPPPDGDPDVPVGEPPDGPVPDGTSDPRSAAEPRGDPPAAGDLPQFECARVTPAKPSLTVRPQLLWQVPLRKAPPADGIAVTRNCVSVAAGNSAFIYDLNGNVAWQYNTMSVQPVAGVVADDQGNFYYADGEAFSMNCDGKLRWQVGLRSSRVGAPSEFVLSPDGILYSMQADNRLRAFEKDTGKQLWETKVEEQGPVAVRPAVVAGYRDRIVVQGKEWGLRIFERKTGTLVATIPGDTSFYPFGASGDFGIFAGKSGYNTTGTGYSSRLTVYGFDGTFRWAITSDRHSQPAFVDLQGRLVVSQAPEKPPGIPTLVRYSCDGQRLDETPFPPDADKRNISTSYFLLGADGVAYVTTYSLTAFTDRTHDVIALDRDLRELWRMSFQTAEIARGAALSDDGVLYLALDHPTKPELVAIQTTSPGPAKTSWPSMRNNYWLGGWLAEYSGP